MQDCCQPGLRERKRAATQLAIEEAAVDIAFEQGYEAATAEAIAAKAGVSLRTFFNYFTSKDTAIAGEGLRVSDRARAMEFLAKSEPHLLKGILRVFQQADSESEPGPDLLLRRHVLFKRYPPLLHRHFTHVDVFETEVTQIVAEYFAKEPARRRLAGKVTATEEARMAVTMVGAAIRHSMLCRRRPGVDAAKRAKTVERTLELMADFHEKAR